MLKYCILGLVIRICLLVYGEWQDQNMAVKFTDVDYFVFNDAAAFVSKGLSPYKRSTYRYTPLLAFILQPNLHLQCFGKILFIVCDILTGVLVYSITLTNGHRHQTAALCSCLWIFNPLTMVVSTRGNAESIMSFLVLGTIQLLQKQHIALSAIVYAFAVHFKIYPITYALCLYFNLGKSYSTPNVSFTKQNQLEQKMTEQRDFRHIITNVIIDLLPNRDRLVFIAVGLSTVLGLTSVFYYWYGWEFIYETYLYHITREDTRHNFSPYFYMMYLLGASKPSTWLKIVTFLPQFLLMVSISINFYHDLTTSFFLITFVFVTLNKVCTSQYFLWYLCLLPFLVPTVELSVTNALILTMLWFSAQAVWLLPAYYLEFEGVNTFIYIWMAGLIFCVVNMYIIYQIIKNYQPFFRRVVKR